MYNAEVKDKTLLLLKEHSVKEVAEQTKISIPTLYKWKKEHEILIQKSKEIKLLIEKGEYEKGIELANQFPNYRPIQSQLMTIYIKTGKYEKGIELANQFPNDEPIQNQMITIYIETKQYEKAIELANHFPNNEPIQSQMMTIYIKTNQFEKGIEFANQFSNYEPIQSQLMTIYIKTKQFEKGIELANQFPNYRPIQSQLMTIYIKTNQFEKAVEIADRFPNDELIQNKLSYLNDLINYKEKFEKNGLKEANLSEINLDGKEKKFDRNINILRAKILSGIICLDDIQNLESIKYQLEEREYLLIKACIFEKLNLKKKCVETVQEITDITSKDKNQLLQSIAKNNKFFSLEKWDYLIGWSIDSVDEYLEVSKLKVSSKENKCTVQKSKKIKDNIQTENLSSEKKAKRKKDLKVISGSFSSQRTKNISKNKSEKVRKQTIYESLNSDYKQAVYDLKLKYYLEMYDEHKKIDAMFKYDRLEDVLNCENSNSKAFYQLLLMLRDIQYNFEKDYPKEYEIINNRISEIKVLTKKG